MDLTSMSDLMRMAEDTAKFSPDPSTKVGAVIAKRNNEVVSAGYNSFPKKCDQDPKIYADRPRKYRRIIHAEINALLRAGLFGQGCKIFVTVMPCSQCAAALIEAGIREVYCPLPTRDMVERWGESFVETVNMFSEAKVKLTYT